MLRRYGRDDLGVLLYIGALAALVSALLLVVQHRARKHAARRHQLNLPILILKNTTR